MRNIPRIIACLLIVCILPVFYPAADADGFNLNPYTQYDTLFNIDVDTDSGVAFLETNEKTANLAFQHKYESNYLYSYIQSDVLVLNYFSSDRYPVLRTWITYCADNAQYIHSVSFEINGTTYTLSDVGDKDRVEKTDNGYRERLLIRYGKNNSDFFAEILSSCIGYLLNNDDENKKAPVMKMTLHGLENIEVYVPDTFWTDFGLLALPFTSNDFAWLSYIADNEGNPCKVKK